MPITEVVNGRKAKSFLAIVVFGILALSVVSAGVTATNTTEQHSTILWDSDTEKPIADHIKNVTKPVWSDKNIRAYSDGNLRGDVLEKNSTVDPKDIAFKDGLLNSSTEGSVSYEDDATSSDITVTVDSLKLSDVPYLLVTLEEASNFAVDNTYTVTVTNQDNSTVDNEDYLNVVMGNKTNNEKNIIDVRYSYIYKIKTGEGDVKEFRIVRDTSKSSVAISSGTGYIQVDVPLSRYAYSIKFQDLIDDQSKSWDLSEVSEIVHKVELDTDSSVDASNTVDIDARYYLGQITSNPPKLEGKAINGTEITVESKDFTDYFELTVLDYTLINNVDLRLAHELSLSKEWANKGEDKIQLRAEFTFYDHADLTYNLKKLNFTQGVSKAYYESVMIDTTNYTDTLKENDSKTDEYVLNSGFSLGLYTLKLTYDFTPDVEVFLAFYDYYSEAAGDVSWFRRNVGIPAAEFIAWILSALGFGATAVGIKKKVR